MVAIRNELCNEGEFNFPVGQVKKTNVKAILDKKNSVSEKYSLSEEDIGILEHWNYFINLTMIKNPFTFLHVIT